MFADTYGAESYVFYDIPYLEANVQTPSLKD